MSVTLAPLALESALHRLIRPGDFVDCYATRPRPEFDAQPIEAVAAALFADMPGWARTLMRIRDAAVAPLGLKTTRDLAPHAGAGRIGIFPLISLTETEAVLGADDRHLSFRVSVIRPAAAPETVRLATWVRRRNRLGRVYLATIMPFHKLIVRASLARLSDPA